MYNGYIVALFGYFVTNAGFIIIRKVKALFNVFKQLRLVPVSLVVNDTM